MSLCGLQFQILLENHIGTRAHPLPLLSCHKEKGSDEILQESEVPNQIYLTSELSPSPQASLQKTPALKSVNIWTVEYNTGQLVPARLCFCLVGLVWASKWSKTGLAMGPWQSGWLLLTSSFLWEADELTDAFIFSPKLCKEPLSSSSQNFPWPTSWIWDSHSSAFSLSHSSCSSFSIPQVWHGFTFLSKNSPLTIFISLF